MMTFTRMVAPVLLVCLVFSQNPRLRADETTPQIPFQKTGRVILDLGGPGSFDECHAKYPCVLKVGDQWWMWYNGRAKDCFTGAIGLAKSQDGLTWTKQNQGRAILKPGPQGGFDSTKIDHPAVLHFDGRFLMWYTMGDDNSQYTIGFATSDDGLHWKKQNDGRPVIGLGQAGKFDAEAAMHPCAARTPDGVIHLWYFGRPDSKSQFSIGHAASRDGLSWKKENNGNAVLKPEAIGGLKELAVYNCCVLHEDGNYRMWYTAAYKDAYQRYEDHSGGIRYAQSRDGTHWIKDKAPVFFNGPRGSIDEYSAYAPSVVRRKEGLWMYYSIAHLEDVSGDPRRNRVGLAVEKKKTSRPD